MSPIPLGFLALSGAGAAVSYWLATLGGAGDENATSVAIDSAKNIYSAGFTVSAGAGSNDCLLVKRDSLGAVLWQRLLGGGSADQIEGLAVDSFSNVYVVGRTGSSGAGSNDFLLAKYNSSGTIQWQRTLGGASFDSGISIEIDDSDNIFIGGFTQSEGQGSNDFLLAKYNSSGTIQWQRILGGAGNDQARSIKVSSTGEIYVCGLTSSQGAGSNDALITKYNSSGTIQWQRILGGTGSEIFASLELDSSDNVYLAGETGSIGAGSANLLLAKYNSSGTIQWQRILGGAEGERARSISIDSTSNLYVLGETSSTVSGDFNFLLAKYNSSGVIQFQRILGAATSSQGYGIKVDSNGVLHLIGNTNSTGAGATDFLSASLPGDGSLTGTYVLDGVDMIYQSSSFSAATGTLTAATSTLNANTSTLTSSTSTLTGASASLTSHLTLIP